MYRTIVLALDGSEGADRAVPAAAELAARDGARVIVAHAQTRSLETAINARIDEQVEALRAPGVAAAEVVVVPSVIEGREADAIAEVAHDRDADLIVIAGRGRSPFAGAVLGSVTQRLLHVSDRPVLVIPPGEALQRREQAATRTEAGV
jgi:nucleotide-binding universal stress UspA family protein